MLEELKYWQQPFKYAGTIPDDDPYCAHLVTPPQAVLMDPTISTAPFSREDVAEIIALEEGENDGPNWIGLFRLNDGRFAYLEAGCDYTGWG